MDGSVKNIFQIKIYLEGVSPMVWRRLEIDQDTSLLEFHGIIQIVMGWENMHLHQFSIYNEIYGVSWPGGTSYYDDPADIPLKKFQFKEGDQFLYDYNSFAGPWRHQMVE